MSGQTFPLRYTVYANKRDLTKWVTRVEIEQPRGCLYRQFTVTLAGWSALEEGASWDIFATLDSATPRAVDLIRNGIVPPDRERAILVRRGEVPKVQVTGYDYVYVMMRRAPRDTIVVVPNSGLEWGVASDGRRYLVENTVQRALDEYDSGSRLGAGYVASSSSMPVGQYQIWAFVRDLHALLKRLCSVAGTNYNIRLPNYQLKPFVIPPSMSYWQAIRELVRPYAAEISYDRDRNSVSIIDPLVAQYMPAGATLTLPAGALTSIRGEPQTRKRVRRVIVAVP